MLIIGVFDSFSSLVRLHETPQAKFIGIIIVIIYGGKVFHKFFKLKRFYYNFTSDSRHLDKGYCIGLITQRVYFY